MTVVDDSYDNDIEVTPDLEAAVQAEITALRSQGKLARIEPRCKICRDEPIRNMVNKLLSMGLTQPAIVSALEHYNEDLPEKEKINYYNVRNHQRRHFNASQPAQRVYEAIVARRQADVENDIEGVIGAAVNAYSFLETIMVKGYAHLRDESTVVPYNDGVKAALKLHDLAKDEGGQQSVAEILARQGRIVAAFKEIVPPEYHEAILARIEGAPIPEVIDATLVEDDADDDDDDYRDGDDF